MTENSQSESEPESYESDSDEEQGRNRRALAVVENRLNAIKCIMRNLEAWQEEYERPSEYETEAVSMAIRQHGLRNNKSEKNKNHCKVDEEEATTSDDIIEDNICLTSKERMHYFDSNIQNLAINQNFKTICEFNDDDFLTEAVAVAIKKKGLSSSSCKALE